MDKLVSWMRRRRVAMTSIADVAAWACAAAVAASARVDFDVRQVSWTAVGAFWILVSLAYLGLGRLVGLHRGRAPLGSLQETRILGLVTAVTGGIAFVTNLNTPAFALPRSVPIITMFFALVIMGWARAWWRWGTEVGRILPGTRSGEPVLVLGAGTAGGQLVWSMLTTPDGAWNPVALLDDDPGKKYLRLSGIPVRGMSHDVARLAAETGAKILVVAIPSMDSERLQVVTAAALDVGMRVKVLPTVLAMMSRVHIGDVRDLDLRDLLGRREVTTDVGAIAGYLNGRRVLVTGAGGSIGSELCRQINDWAPAELIMLDRDESALHAVQLTLTGQALLDSADVVLADIRDEVTMRTILMERRPHVVFHAAALKHLPMLEQYPGEAVKTNIWGTLAVLEAAQAAGVEKFVNISTDKAADPVSVLGYTKRIAERLTATVAGRANGTYLSVRFGNVLGSRGSVLISFAAQIAAGGPVTVTHPDVMRYFMTVEEAVQLVIQSAAIGSDGEALVLDMGRPVSIDDVARRLIQLSGERVEIEYTGLRKGEKLTELLWSRDEPDFRPVHPLISHVTVPPMSLGQARALNPWMSSAQLTKDLAELSARSTSPQHAVARETASR